MSKHRTRNVLAIVAVIVLVAAGATAWYVQRTPASPFDGMRASATPSGSDDRARTLRGSAGGLRGLPQHAAGPAVRRRPGDGHAAGHHLRHQHHPGQGHRHRPLQPGGLRPGHAPRRGARRPPPVSGHAVSVLRQAGRRRRARAVRVLHARGETRGPGRSQERHRLADEHALAAGTVERSVHRQWQLSTRQGAGASTRSCSTAAPTWCRVPGTAAAATRRAAR